MDLNNIDKKRLYSLFKQMDNVGELEPSSPPTDKNNILIVDSLNTFIRSFMAIPTINTNGLHVGGIAGFLKSIGYAIKLLKPHKVICVFDGNGGSLRRRKIYPEYKGGKRSRIKFNRAYQGMATLNEENKNLEIEFSRVISYLKILPVTIISIDYIEADDTIAYLTTDYFKGKTNYIMSTDKDFLQLVNINNNNTVTKVWSPTKKKLYGCDEIFDEYGISCRNFIYYRVLTGDDSDNIPGIQGAGIKTIIKAFPFLQNDKESSINEILNYSKNNVGKYKIYENIAGNEDILHRNYELMQLKSSIIQPFTQLKINEIMDKPVQPLSAFKFHKLISDDNMSDVFPNYNHWLTETWAMLNSLI